MTNVPVLFKYNKTLSQDLLIFLLWFSSFVVFSLQSFNHFLDGKKHQVSFWIQVKVLSLLLRIQDSHKHCSTRGPMHPFVYSSKRNAFHFQCTIWYCWSSPNPMSLIFLFSFFSLLPLICRECPDPHRFKLIFGPLYVYIDKKVANFLTSVTACGYAKQLVFELLITGTMTVTLSIF